MTEARRVIFLARPNGAGKDMARVSARIAQGGHAIPEAVIRRRFATGLDNFHKLYKVLVDSWTHYDNSGQSPVLIASEDIPR